MAVVECDYADLCGLGLPLALSLQLQLQDLKLSGALLSAKASPFRFLCQPLLADHQHLGSGNGIFPFFFFSLCKSVRKELCDVRTVRIYMY